MAKAKGKAITHSHLVAEAAKWLCRSGHTVVATEVAAKGGASGEQPDAIGWRGWRSTLVECKVSLEDFRADAAKDFRKNADAGIGQQRYFCVPRGLIKPSDVPTGWGLLEYTGRGMSRTKKSTRFRKCNSRHEVEILVSVSRRLGLVCPKGISVRNYVHETANKATVSVLK